MTKWFLPPDREGTMRLFGFPYAGGGAAVFRGLAPHLPAHVEVWGVRPPGRESRFGEEPFRRVEDFVAAFLPVLRPLLDRPFAFLGHSMGAILAFELTRTLRRGGGPQPRRLFVCARRAPQRPEPEAVYRLPDEAFRAAMQRLYGTESGLFAHSELLELMTPTLKADVELNTTYRPAPEEPLEVPISAYGGTEDRTVTREDLEAWREHTRGAFAVRLFRGDHFFVTTDPAAVAAAVGEGLG